MLASAALEGALAIARTELAEGLGPGLAAPRRGDAVDALDLAIIGMGKCGARELNYISDVDVVYVVAPVEPAAAGAAPHAGAEGETAPLKLTENECSTIGTELVARPHPRHHGPRTRTRPLGGRREPAPRR